MNEIKLTTKEKLILEEELKSSMSHRKKQILNFVFYIMGGCILVGVINYLRTGNISIKLYFALFIISLIMLFTLCIAYILSLRGTNKLKRDLINGKKITGKEKVKSINFFNRTITLFNGVKVYESNSMNNQIKKGDTISYEISSSNQHVFNCVKTKNA